MLIKFNLSYRAQQKSGVYAQLHYSMRSAIQQSGTNVRYALIAQDIKSRMHNILTGMDIAGIVQYLSDIPGKLVVT